MKSTLRRRCCFFSHGHSPSSVQLVLPMRSAVLVMFLTSGFAFCSASSSIATTSVMIPHCSGVIVMCDIRSHCMMGSVELLSTISVETKKSHCGLFDARRLFIRLDSGRVGS